MQNEFTRKGARIYRNGELWCKFRTKHEALCAVVTLRLSPEYKHLRLLTKRTLDGAIETVKDEKIVSDGKWHETTLEPSPRK